MDIMTILGVAGGVVTTASAITAMTPTPDPNTTWGKVYRGIEIAGLVVAKAKQRGVVDQLGADVQALVKVASEAQR
jgi:hypothetical protein